MTEQEATIDVIKQMNVYQKISAVSAEVGRIQMSLNVATKTDKNGNTLKSYKAISINDVVDALIPLLSKYRLVVLPVAKELLSQEQIERSTQFGSTNQFFVRMKVTYRVVNIDNPEEFVDADGYGDGIDSGDKSLGKANTYARKFCLVDLFNLSRGDEPDAEASPQEGYKKKETFDQSAMAVEFTTLTGELRKLNVDIHEETVASYIKNKAQVNNLDGGYLLTDLPAMSRVIAVMKAIIQSKK